MFGHRLWRGPRNDLNDLHGEIGRTQGRVVGTDSDAEILSLARQDAEAAKVANVKFQQLDACAVVLRNAFDLAYARFLLSHLNQPNDCVGAMIEACTPGGIIVIEDTDFAGSFCYPICDAYERYNELYQELVRRRGGDPNIGPKLSGILRGAGIQEVDLNVIQPAHIYGEGKLMAPLTNVADFRPANRRRARHQK